MLAMLLLLLMVKLMMMEEMTAVIMTRGHIGFPAFSAGTQVSLISSPPFLDFGSPAASPYTPLFLVMLDLCSCHWMLRWVSASLSTLALS